MSLTSKRKEACKLYVNGLPEQVNNMTACCKAAGFSDKGGNCKQQAHEILTDSDCKSYIEELREGRDDYTSRSRQSAIDKLWDTIELETNARNVSISTLLARSQPPSLWP